MSRDPRNFPSDDSAGPPEPVSWVEDLDPEPPGSAAKWRVREVVLGLVLLVSVLAWALGSWWQDESKRSHYEQGQQAAAQRHWDDAFADYSAADGYKDAAALAENALTQIQERDREYDSAVRERDGGPASLVLQAARAVQTIQPGYKDVDAIAAQAEDRLYTDALSGTVVLRTDAQPPGLYYRGPGGWHYLQGSDERSSVLSEPLSDAAQKYVVYDVPQSGDGRRTTGDRRPAAGKGQQTTGKAGRRLVLATISGDQGDPAFQDLQLDPAEYDLYICGAAGVWGLRYGPVYGESPVVKSGFGSVSELAFERISPTSTPSTPSPVVLPGIDGTVVDFGHRSDMLLFAAYGPRVNEKTNTVLYVARGDGSQARAVYWTTGTLVSAALSPDDRYALAVVAQAPQDVAGKMTVSALLLDLSGTGTGAPPPPVTLQEISMDGINTVAGVRLALTGQLAISGVFLEKGAFEHKLLIGWYDGHPPNAPGSAVRIKLVDVRHPRVALCETTVDYAGQAWLPVTEQADGRTLLVYDEGAWTTSGVDRSPSVNLRMLRVDTSTDGASETATVTANIFQLPLPRFDVTSGDIPLVSSSKLRGDNLVYQTQMFDSRSGQMSYSGYIVPLATAQDPGGAGIQAVPLFGSVAPPEPPGSQDVARSGIAGPGAFAYTDAQGALHALSYGATADVALEKGVGAIVELTASTLYKALR